MLGLTGGTSDPYVKTTFASNEVDTDIKYKCLNPIFNEQIHMPIMTPAMQDRVQIEVYDYDTMNEDDLIGTIYLRFSDCMLGRIGPRWFNMYGDPGNVSLMDVINVRCFRLKNI